MSSDAKECTSITSVRRASTANASDLAEIERRILRDPRFRNRIELLTLAWSVRPSVPPPAMSDDRVAFADLMRRIQEPERDT